MAHFGGEHTLEEDKKSETNIVTSKEKPKSSEKRRRVDRYSVLIREVYAKHNPEKLDQVDSLLQKYVGQEKDLYNKICMKCPGSIDVPHICLSHETTP